MTGGPPHPVVHPIASQQGNYRTGSGAWCLKSYRVDNPHASSQPTFQPRVTASFYTSGNRNRKRETNRDTLRDTVSGLQHALRYLSAASVVGKTMFSARFNKTKQKPELCISEILFKWRHFPLTIPRPRSSLSQKEGCAISHRGP